MLIVLFALSSVIGFGLVLHTENWVMDMVGLITGPDNKVPYGYCDLPENTVRAICSIVVVVLLILASVLWFLVLYHKYVYYKKQEPQQQLHKKH